MQTMKNAALTVAAVTALFVCPPGAQPQFRIVDLGHAVRASDPSWDGSAGFERKSVATFDRDGYAAGRITVEEHFGTHLDAPSHFSKSGWSVDQIPVDRLYRPAVRIDVSAKAAGNPDYLVTPADIRAFESAHGRIPQGAIALIATGWDRFWPDRGRYMNEREGVKHFPGLSADAVTLLARDRRVAGIGIDTPSVDYGPSTTFEAHKISMALNVFHVENAAHLTGLPASGFTVVVAPLDIAGGSGAPTRIFAMLASR
jgi:kynurenine formamidase